MGGSTYVAAAWGIGHSERGKLLEMLLKIIFLFFRPHWANIREKYFSTGDNKASLDIIEKVNKIISSWSWIGLQLENDFSVLVELNC